jgi:hypothetical protein
MEWDLKKRVQLGDPGVNGVILLEFTLDKQSMKIWSGIQMTLYISQWQAFVNQKWTVD